MYTTTGQHVYHSLVIHKQYIPFYRMLNSSTSRSPAAGSSCSASAHGSSRRSPAAGSSSHSPVPGSSLRSPAAGSSSRSPASGSSHHSSAAGSLSHSPAPGSTDPPTATINSWARLSPYPKCLRPANGKRRKGQKSEILTSSPFKKLKEDDLE